MKTYIRKNISGYYIQFEEDIDSQYWSGKIGTTYEDFLNGKWILLSNEQVAFHNEHPTASIEEVLNMNIPVHVRTLDEAKREKIEAIEEFDNSEAVNGFEIEMGDTSITTWITPEQRANYKNSLDSAEILGLEEVHPMFNGITLTLSLQTAKTALAQIQIYADRCFIVTETHKANVNALDTIEAVDAYDYMTGYPENLLFVL